jgi:hypothetical protein
MRKQVLKLLVAIFALQLIVGICAAQEKTAPGFTLAISEARGFFESAPGVRALDVNMTNTSNEEIREACPVVYRMFNLSVTYEGVPMQEKEAVQQHRKRGEFNSCSSEQLLKPLQPGEHRRSLMYISDFYEMSKPGQYEVTVAKETNPNDPQKSVTVTSNTITMVVTEKQAKEAEAILAKRRSAPPLALDAEKSSVRAGAPIIVDITRKNMSDKTLFLHSPYNVIQWYDFDVRISLVPAPETELLQQAKAPNARFVDIGQVASLEPEETTKTNVDLNYYYDMSKPGVYYVAASLVCKKCDSTQIVKSNTVAITVFPAGDPTPAQK